MAWLFCLAFTLVAIGCAGLQPRPVNLSATPVNFIEGVHLPPAALEVERRVEQFHGAGNALLQYVAFRGVRNTHSTPRVALVYLHGLESHAGWFEGVARSLAATGYDVYCLERRGSGLNREPQGFLSGDVDNHRMWLADVHAFRRQLPTHYNQFGLIGLSLGGKLAVGYDLAYPGDFDSLILITPGLRPRVDFPFWKKIGVITAGLFAPRTGFKLPLTPPMFTANPEFQQMIAADPLRLREATARFLLANRRLDSIIEQRIGEARTPTLLILAEHDPIINNADVAGLLGSGRHKLLLVRRFADQRHSMQFDALDELVQQIEQWFELLAAEGLLHAGEVRS